MSASTRCATIGITRRAAAVLLGCAIVAPSHAPAQARDARPVAFVGVHVRTMRGDEVLRDRTVVVRGDSIAHIGPAAHTRVPGDAVRIAGEGRWLVPGLVDAHVHLRDEGELLSYLAHGVTTVLHLSGGTGRIPDPLALRTRIRDGTLAGPTVLASGRMLDGDPPVFAGVSTVVRTPADARRVVAEQHAGGADFIKVYNNLDPDSHRAAVDEAHRRSLAVVGHVPRKPDRPRALQSALANGQDMIAHGEELFFTHFYGATDSVVRSGGIPSPDRSTLPGVIALLGEKRVTVTPNLSFVAMTRRLLDSTDAVLESPEARFLSPEVRTMWREQTPARRADRDAFDRRERGKSAFLRDLVRALRDGEILMLLGSDASAPGMFPGASAHLELAELVAAGLSPAEALATGTRNAGEFLARHLPRERRTGTIAVGHRADLLLVDADPVADPGRLVRPAGVMARGRWYTREELDRRREELARRYAAAR